MTNEKHIRKYPIFTEEMKKDYTILIPTMLPRHFKIMIGIMKAYGYKAELLENMGPDVITEGLKYVHNDTCYPAQLVIGQMIDALNSGKYDKNKVALMITQTGGGCRASNYIHLLRKALEKAGYGYIPVISLNFSGLEKESAFKMTPAILHRFLYAICYGDLLMNLVNQTKPYELNSGDAEALADLWTERLTAEMAKGKVSRRNAKKNYALIIEDFAKIPKGGSPKPRVGIVGEIFVKFSPLGNNNLEDFLVSEGAEVVVPGLLDFCLYVVYNGVLDRKLYGRNKKSSFLYKFLIKFFESYQMDLIKAIESEGSFNPPMPFHEVPPLTEGIIGMGVKMGEGWLLTAEMIELIHEGAMNIVCTQPFGCLPNHIAGKGMMKPIKEKYPEANIVAIDYDSGATKINQENRIKLMLSTAIISEDNRPIFNK
ncbi:MAG: 2-hydroxyglutaryl-CoA dehydratase [Ruminococcaceae bacterium]|nr:2-hydroxyglutaryl-CoA dehydratase [Oscillospiraceae bacterium]